MSRLPNAILQGAFGAGRAPMLDPQFGGMFGFAPEPAEWVSAQRYVRRNLIALVIEAPKGFKYFPEPNFWFSALKAIIEKHPKTIDGLKSDLNVQTAETNVGGAGEMMQDPTNVTRERSTPSFTWTDTYGRPIQIFLEQWIRGLIMDPDSKVPDIATLVNKPTDLLSDMYSMTVLFMEPDPSHTTINKAWLCSNMYPLSTGEIAGKRDLTSDGETLELSVTFSAYTQTGIGVRQFAQDVLNRINFVGAAPNLRPAFIQAISPDVTANGSGYAEQANQLSNTALKV